MLSYYRGKNWSLEGKNDLLKVTQTSGRRSDSCSKVPSAGRFLPGWDVNDSVLYAQPLVLGLVLGGRVISTREINLIAPWTTRRVNQWKLKITWCLPNETLETILRDVHRYPTDKDKAP